MSVSTSSEPGVGDFVSNYIPSFAAKVLLFLNLFSGDEPEALPVGTPGRDAHRAAATRSNAENETDLVVVTRTSSNAPIRRASST